ncbi:MAG: NAD-dependent isocitrate dehydrogenase, partial [Tissierellia bacterium]|nr:NAD-dependent isocitrate dehydrogenase [Tissierellia bacterium]
GKNMANPTSAMLSGIMMLKHIGEYEAAIKMERSLAKVLSNKATTTIDLGGKLGTKEFTNEIIKNLDIQ